MTTRDRYIVGGTLGALLLVWFVIHYWHRDPSIVTPAVHATIDSLKATKKPAEAVIDSLAVAGLTHSVTGASAAGRARVSEAKAAATGARADTAAARARRTDSTPDSLAAAWKEAYELRTAERDTLLVALAQKDSAYRGAAASANDFRLALTNSEQRRQAVENLNSSLQTAVAKAERGCRVMWTIPCPSRPVSFVLGAVGGAAAIVVLHNRP